MRIPCTSANLCALAGRARGSVPVSRIVPCPLRILNQIDSGIQNDISVAMGWTLFKLQLLPGECSFPKPRTMALRTSIRPTVAFNIKVMETTLLQVHYMRPSTSGS